MFISGIQQCDLVVYTHTHTHTHTHTYGFPVAQCSRICPQDRRHRFDPWVGRTPWRKKWQPAPGFLPGKSHGQSSLVGYSPWGFEDLDPTEQTHTHTYIHSLSIYLSTYLSIYIYTHCNPYVCVCVYIHIYIYIYIFFFRFFSIIGYYKILNISRVKFYF